MPYCDVTITASYMRKVVVEDLKLADEYHTKVLCAKLSDVALLTEILAD